MLDFISTSDHGTPYYDGLLVTAEFREQHAKLIQKFISGQVKLAAKKGTPHCLLTTKTSKGDRVMFAPVKVEHNGVTFNCLASLEDIENHDYQKSTFLNHPGAFRVFQENLPQQINVASFSNVAETTIELSPDDGEDAKLESAYVYNHKYVILSEVQNQLFEKPLPLIVNGGAGAGKSLTGLLKLASLLELANDGAPKKLLYVTESKKLVAQMRENWNNLPFVERPVNVAVEFITYDELLRKARPELVNATRVNEKEKSHFKTWLAEYTKSQKNKPQASKSKVKNKRGKLTKGKQQTPAQSPFDIIVANPDRLYQEFRIISGYSDKPKVYITKLGTKQSLFSDPKQRDLCFQAYQAYLNHLTEQNQYDASFTRFELADQDKYDSTICDEWLDCSPLQSQQLLDSTRNAQIMYCGDINQSLADTKPSYPFLQRLCYEREIILSELDLPGSYRCPSPVIEFANAVLDIKHALVGSAVKKTQGRISSTESSESHTSNIVWLEKISAEEKVKFNELSKSTDFVIITLPDHIDDARKQFPNAIIFTPAEIKGLEYRAVMLYRIFEHPICTAANNEFSPENISNGSVHRPKFSADVDPAYHPFLNSIYTAMTRTTESLYVYQPSHHPTNKITGYLKDQLKTDAPGQIQTDNFTPATREQLIAEVIRLWNNDNQKQAQQIIEREQLAKEPQIQALLNPAEESTEPKVLTLRSATPQEQKIFDDLYNAKNQQAFNNVFKRILDPDVFFNALIFKLPHPFNTLPKKPYLYHPIVMLMFSGSFQKRITITDKFYNHFLIYLQIQKNAHSIFSTSFFTPRNYDQESENFFLGYSTAENEKLRNFFITAIKYHLDQKTICLKYILDNLFVISNVDDNQFIYLSTIRNNDIDGHLNFNIDLILSLILEKYKSLSEQEIVEELFKPSCLSNNFSPFFLLTKHGSLWDVVKKLFETKPGLYNFIDLSHLFKPQSEQNQKTILHNLLDPENEIEISREFAFLRDFFDKNLSLAQDFTIEHLCKIQFFIGNLFFTLCMSTEGIAFLQYLFDKNPNLLDQLPISALFGANIYNARRFYAISLLMTEAGLELIRTIFKKSNRFSSELTIKDLQAPLTNIIQELIKLEAYDIFELMFENNPRLATEFSQLKSITDPTLKAIIEKYLANALRSPTEKEKAYLQQFLSIRATEKSLLAFLNHKDAVDYLLNIRVNDSNGLSEMAIKNTQNLKVLLNMLTKNPHLLQKFCNPALFRVRGNQGGDLENKSTLECLEADEAGKQIVQLLFKAPKTIRLRQATAEEQKQLDALCKCNNQNELRIALTKIKNVSIFFNEIIFDLIPHDKAKASLIVSLLTLQEKPADFLNLRNFITLMWHLLQSDIYIRTNIFSESFFSLAESTTLGVQIFIAPAPIDIVCYPLIKSAITEHLKYQTPALKFLLNNFFFRGNYEGEYYFLFGFFYESTDSIDTNFIVTLLLEKYKKLTDEELWQQLCQRIPIAGNISPLEILTNNPDFIKILQELLQTRPGIYSHVMANQLLDYPDNNSSSSPFINLFRNGCFDFLYNLFEKTAIYKQIESRLFYSFSNIFASTFYSLCAFDTGLDFLNYLFGKNPELLLQMEREDLFKCVSPIKHKFHAFDELCKKEKERSLLKKILTENKNICNQIAMTDLVVVVYPGYSKNTYQELIDSKCYDIFELMFENNHNLVVEFSKQKDITDSTLKRMIERHLKSPVSAADNKSGFFHQSPVELVSAPVSEQKNAVNLFLN